MANLCGVVVALGLISAGCGSHATASHEDNAANRPEQLIRRDAYRRLVVEVDAVADLGPRAAVASDIASGLEGLVDKPDGVEMITDGELAAAGSDHAWSFAEMSALADDSYDLDVQSDTIKLHTMFVDGHHEDDDQGGGKILGLAWGNTHIVMFKETLEASCSGIGVVLREQVCSAAEQSVWIHEIGHTLGLVDNGVLMQTNHRDSAHGHHDSNDACVMYWAYDGEAAIDVLFDRFDTGGSGALGFDDNCLNDIAAVRGEP